MLQPSVLRLRPRDVSFLTDVLPFSAPHRSPWYSPVSNTDPGIAAIPVSPNSRKSRTDSTSQPWGSSLPQVLHTKSPKRISSYSPSSWISLISHSLLSESFLSSLFLDHLFSLPAPPFFTARKRSSHRAQLRLTKDLEFCKMPWGLLRTAYQPSL